MNDLDRIYEESFNDELEKIAFRQVENNPTQRAVSAAASIGAGGLVGVPAALELGKRFGAKGTAAGLVAGGLTAVGLNRLIMHLDTKKKK